MGSVDRKHSSRMGGQAVYLAVFLAMSVSSQKVPHNLPVLFQYADKAHNVAVFRGAELRQAIAAGLVPGFGNLGREGKKIDTTADDMAAARAAADARAAAEARAAADARAAAEARARAAAAQAAADARAAAARPSKLDLAEKACVQACMNLAGQCKNPFM